VDRNTTTPFFVADGEALVPTEFAVGPWSDSMQHGRLFSGLGARAAEQDAVGSGLRIVRITTELFRAAPMEPLTVALHRVRDGRRIRLARVEIDCAGRTVGLVHVLLLATGEPSPGRSWMTSDWQAPPPEQLERFQFQNGHDPWDLRYLPAGEGGRRRAWLRDVRPLVGSEAPSPIVRVASVADFASPLSSFTESDEVEYINTDITLHVVRPPVDEWIGFDVRGRVAADGLAVGHAGLFDRQGPVGFSTTSSMAQLRESPW
jgi:acyl-CoA thioesterase